MFVILCGQSCLTNVCLNRDQKEMFYSVFKHKKLTIFNKTSPKQIFFEEQNKTEFLNGFFPGAFV